MIHCMTSNATNIKTTKHIPKLYCCERSFSCRLIIHFLSHKSTIYVLFFNSLGPEIFVIFQRDARCRSVAAIISGSFIPTDP